MPNQRKEGTKLIGAYVEDETDHAFIRLALKKGFPNRADYLRHLIDREICSEATRIAEAAATYEATTRETADTGN
ncbi:MAG: hypothetical protein ACYS26_13420 [Planctomycetota bacterium]|jgi:hypothetical protein